MKHMGVLVIIALCISLAFTGVCFGEDASGGLNVEPISPEELTSKIEQVGENIITVGQGAAPPAAMIGIIIAGLLIFVGLPLLGITKSVFKAGMSMLFGVAILYVLVFHGSSVIGVIKGIFGVGAGG